MKRGHRVGCSPPSFFKKKRAPPLNRAIQIIIVATISVTIPNNASDGKNVAQKITFLQHSQIYYCSACSSAKESVIIFEQVIFLQVKKPHLVIWLRNKRNQSMHKQSKDTQVSLSLSLSVSMDTCTCIYDVIGYANYDHNEEQLLPMF